MFNVNNFTRQMYLILPQKNSVKYRKLAIRQELPVMKMNVYSQHICINKAQLLLILISYLGLLQSSSVNNTDIPPTIDDSLFSFPSM